MSSPFCRHGDELALSMDRLLSNFELRSRILERDGDDFKVSIRYLRKKLITVALDTVFRINYHTLDATHAWSYSRMEGVLHPPAS